MDKIEYFKDFLHEISSANQSKRKKIIKLCSSDKIKIIYEIFINLKSVRLTDKDEKILKAHQKPIRNFFKKKLTLEEAKNFFLKHCRIIPYVIKVVVCKYLEIEICDWLLNHG